MVVSSTQSKYFLPIRVHLIEQYGELLALAFASEEFYSLDVINLYEMPAYREQHKVLSTIHKRAVKLMQEAVAKHEVLPLHQATEIAWQQVEEMFLQWESETKEP